MAVKSLILVSNMDSVSKKYSLYNKNIELARFEIDYQDNVTTMHFISGDKVIDYPLYSINIDDSLQHVLSILVETKVIDNYEAICTLAIKISAPSAYFLQDRIITDTEINKLELLTSVEPVYVQKTLKEIYTLRQALPNAVLVGISDSAFHSKKPDYTWNYGINLDDADKYDIKRFGYHGLSLESVTNQLKLTKYSSFSKVIVCHLGGSASVSAIFNAMPIDTTTGYSLNEGLIMNTMSGSLDFNAGISYASLKGISPQDLVIELNTQSGLLGLSGISSDVITLIEEEAKGNHRASLALSMYVYNIRQAIGSMVATLEGVDMLVFTGILGQRSAVLRKRITDGLEYLNIVIDKNNNNKATHPAKITALHPRTRTKPVIVVPTQEEHVIVLRARKLVK